MAISIKDLQDQGKAINLKGMRVDTPKGPGSIDEDTPAHFSFGYSVIVHLDTPTSASGRNRFGVEEVTLR